MEGLSLLPGVWLILPHPVVAWWRGETTRLRVPGFPVLTDLDVLIFTSSLVPEKELTHLRQWVSNLIIHQNDRLVTPPIVWCPPLGLLTL